MSEPTQYDEGQNPRAFPTATTYHQAEGPEYANGMSLRDYFAGQALASPLAARFEPAQSRAKWCYEMADAMLKARKANE